MIPLILNLDGTGFADIERANKIVYVGQSGKPVQLAVLDKGTSKGRPSVAIRLDLHDGTVIIAETTARLLCTAARAIMAKYPNLFEGGD